MAHLLADEPPARDFVGMPCLTVPMVARLQGFPDSWKFTGRKTNAYRQVGNAFPRRLHARSRSSFVACLTSRRLAASMAG